MMAIAHKERHKKKQNVDTSSLEPSVDFAKILYREVFLNVDTLNFRFMSYRIYPSCHPNWYLQSFDHWPAKAAAHTAAMAAFDWARLQVQKFQVEDRKRWRYIRCAAKSQQKNLGRIAWHPLLKLNGTFESMIFSLSVGYVTMEGNHFPATVYTTWNVTNRYPKWCHVWSRFDIFLGVIRSSDYCQSLRASIRKARKMPLLLGGG